MIVGINGVSESGKDSIGRICIEEWGCKHLAFATRMKEFALAVDPWVPIDPLLSPALFNTRGQFVRLSVLVARDGWDMAKKNPEVRRLLQAIGTEGGRKTLDEKLWIKQVSPLIRPNKHYVVTDVRFLNEAEFIRNHGGIVVRVERPGYGPALGHISDVHDDSLWDVVIHNDGSLDDLHKKVVGVLAEYFGE
jgi:deoxynucleotide monophosphate kinase-like protein